jgi:hypothetical protein
MTKKAPKQWMYSPKRGPKPKVSAALKGEVSRRADALLENVIMPARVVPPPPDMQWNYLVNLYTKWHGSYFYLCGTWRCPADNCLSEHFDLKFTRLEYAGNGQFNLAYMRHTGQWATVFPDLTLDDCLEQIETNELFWP